MPIFFKFIPTAYTAIRTTFGKASSELVKDGLAFYIPIIQSLIPVSNMVQNMDFTTNIKII